MTNDKNLYDGISNVAWGYFFLYFNININNVSILPSFVGFLLFLSGINKLKCEERDLELLRPLGIMLAFWHGASWAASWISIELDGQLQILDIIVGLINLYFHFQLLTNLASIAAKYQSEGEEQDAKLLNYRTVQTIMLTGMLLITKLSPWLSAAWGYISLAMGLVYIIIGICLMKALFDLRRCWSYVNM